MSNKIRLKRGSGSDPSASDLVIGEVALRTDNGTLFTLKDDGNIAEIGAAAGVSDGDKGDITVSNSGSTFTIDNGVISTSKLASGAVTNGKLANSSVGISKIQNGIINNQKIASDAAIAGTKISPDFGSQNVTSTGYFSFGTAGGTDNFSKSNLRIENTHPTLYLNDTDSNNDFYVRNADGVFNIHDVQAGVNRFTLNSSGTAAFSGNLDVGDGIDVTGLASVIRTTSSETQSILQVKHGNLSQGIGLGYNTISAIGTNPNIDIKLASKGSGEIYLIDNVNAQAGIDVTGAITATGNLTISNTHPQIFFTDTDNNSDFKIQNLNGVFGVRDETNSATRFSIASNGTVNVAGNLDVGAGLDVTGNITVTGTVDGVDIAARNTLFGGLTSSSGVLTNGVTATTQSASDNSTKVATTAYADAAVSNLVDSAPGTLNTLNELAAALGDDANFSTTVTNSIATKLPLAGGTITGNLVLDNATNAGRDVQWQHANDRLAFFDNTKATFGNGADLQIYHNSGFSYIDAQGDQLRIDADQLRVRSNSGESYIEADANSAVKLYFDNSNKFQTSSSGVSVTGNIAVSGTVDGRDVATDGSKLDTYEANGSSYLRSDAADTASGDITFSGGAGAVTIASASDLSFTNGSNWSGNHVKIQHHSNYLYIVGGANGIIFREGNVNRFLFDDNGHFRPNDDSTYDIGTNTFRVRNGYFDTLYGSGANLTNLPSQTDQNFTTALKNKLDGIAAGATNVTNNNQLTNGAGYITSANGGNAATLDGIDSSQFLRSDANDTFSEVLTLSKDTTDVLNFSANSSNSNRGISFNNKTAISASATSPWLRLNNNSEFTNGVYTPLKIRADGGFHVSGTTVIDSNGSISAGRISGTVSAASNADTVDSLHASSFIRSDAEDNVTNHTEWQDNAQVRLGASADMKIYHSGSQSRIEHGGTGQLVIQGNDNDQVQIKKGSSEHGIILNNNGDVELFYNNDRVFRTQERGIRVADNSRFFENSSHNTAILQHADIHHAIIFRGRTNNNGSTITNENTTTFREYGQFKFRTGAINAPERFTIAANGNIGAPSGSNIYNASDVRLKKNVVTLDKGLNTIKSLRPVSFNWIDGFCDEEKDPLYGFIAQEVETVDTNLIQAFSEEVKIGEDQENPDQVISNTLRVNEKFIIPILVKALQELTARVEKLEAG